MNCQSLKCKKAAFNTFVETHQPDIIIGSESWLSPAIFSILFPPNYNVHRKAGKMVMEAYSLLVAEMFSV